MMGVTGAVVVVMGPGVIVTGREVVVVVGIVPQPYIALICSISVRAKPSL